ncbi:helix-turn-helix transcriptional regulator [Azospirillum sp. TSA2s]|uniref:helix-turn-helix transcriptional regulator n=1 Tax=Azospirillum sp. TSA2s TaxID=709810 RepID=UPI0010AA6B67|nr:helix-turn-helix transcriptional regulator [Azospirillum sp. TSA2s]QCG93987.1 helix-turn-helix transcriptional regulator [Azospirillum sp. TSA2s]
MEIANEHQPGQTAQMLTGTQIKRCRQLCDMSQQELADAIGVHRTTIARAEAVKDAIPDDFTSGNMWRTVQVFEARGVRLPALLSIGMGIDIVPPEGQPQASGTARAKPKRARDATQPTGQHKGDE